MKNTIKINVTTVDMNYSFKVNNNNEVELFLNDFHADTVIDVGKIYYRSELIILVEKLIKGWGMKNYTLSY